MKTTPLNFLLAFVMLLFASCQKESLTITDEAGALTSLASKNFNAARTAAECAASSLCIDPANPEYYPESGTSWGVIGSKWKKIDYSVHNTLTGFVVELTFDRETGGASSTVNVTVGGITQSNVTLTQEAKTTLNFSLPDGWSSCTPLTWSFTEVEPFDGQYALTGSGTYYLYGACVVGCDESFTYAKNMDGSYTFTYTPAEDADDAHLVFTFAQGVAATVTGLDGWSVNGSTRQTTMDLVACQTYSWTVTITPDCSGNSNNSNVWTDFKVNDFSKKGTNPNIVIPCP